jgi:6-pyruvoyltetrahydropterin/6-carboxytetrahydropterin synthase
MPFRICKTFEVENGHMLSKHPDLCKFPHGHTRKVEFVLEADSLDENEMVCDFKILKEAMKDYLDSLDHAMCMNTDDPKYDDFKQAYGDRVIGFTKQDPTTEVIAKAIFDITSTRLEEYLGKADVRYPLRTSVKLLSVRLWETSSSWAEYSPNE